MTVEHRNEELEPSQIPLVYRPNGFLEDMSQDLSFHALAHSSPIRSFVERYIVALEGIKAFNLRQNEASAQAFERDFLSLL